MSEDLRARADARLEAALNGSGIRDPRPHLRRMLKHLKDRNPPAFERALSHYESVLVPGVAGEDDPLGRWLEYGRLLAELSGEGAMMAIDGTGRARPADDAPPPDSLILYLPESAETPAAVLRCPAETTAAQDASIQLLVLGRVSISDQPPVGA